MSELENRNPLQDELDQTAIEIVDEDASPKSASKGQWPLLFGLAGIALIGGIGAMAYGSALSSSRAEERQEQTADNLVALVGGMNEYELEHGHFPGAYSENEEGTPLLSWRVHLLPYLGHKELYDQFHLDEPWDSEHNKKLIEKMPDVYANPNSIAEGYKTNYLVPVGDEYLFSGSEGLTLEEITDGTSNTIMIIEVDADRAVTWTKPVDFEVDPDNPTEGVGELRDGTFVAIFADGSTQELSEDISTHILQGLMTFEGDEGFSIRYGETRGSGC